MRVLLLGPYPPPYGGVQTHITGLRQSLLQRGHACDVVNITRHRETNDPGVYHPRSAVALLRLLWTLRYDVLHLHVGGDLPRRVLALMLACTLVPVARTVFTLHSGGYPSSPAGRRIGPRSLAAIAFRRFDAVVGVNDELCSLFRRVGVPAGRVHHIVPYLPEGPADHSAIGRPDVAAFLSGHRPVLTTVGLLEPEYDLGLQVRALGEVIRTHDNAGLLIIGSGSQERALRELIAAQPWAERILLAGDVPHADTLAAIGRSDLVLRTTRYDGDAISVREALTLGTPVLATDNGMRPAGVHLIETTDSAALVTAIHRVLTMPRPAAVAPDTAAALAQILRVYDIPTV